MSKRAMSKRDLTNPEAAKISAHKNARARISENGKR
jgi:hypothetical protein